MSRRGHDRERAVKRLLEEEGWFVIRAPGSLGVADLVALRGSSGEEWYRPRMIEVKSTAGGPYERFGPADRAELIEAAAAAGATPELAYWPPRGKLRFIDAEDWPGV